MILGYVDNQEYRDKYQKTNPRSKHMDLRKDRMALVLDNAKPLFFYEVIKDEERQVHVLFEDATLFVFNKETGLIITIILLSRKRMALYFAAADDYASEHPHTQRCAKVHDKFIKRHYELTGAELKKVKAMKVNHLKGIK